MTELDLLLEYLPVLVRKFQARILAFTFSSFLNLEMFISANSLNLEKILPLLF